jgi:tetratricopeptide (TPR) repeat protein
VLGHRSEKIEKLEESRPISVTETKALSELVGSAANFLGFTNFMTGNISFPKDIVMEVGLFNEAFAQPGEHGWEDIELGYRLWRKGYYMVFSRNALVYRPATEKEKVTKRSESDAIKKARKRLTDLQPILPEIGRFLEELGRNRWEKAKELGEYIYNQDPENHGILTNLGSVYLQQGNIQKANELFKKAISINKFHPLVFEKFGEISFCQSRFMDAFEYFSQSLNIDSNRTRALYFLAQLKNRIPENENSKDFLARDIHIELGGGMFPTKIREEGQDDFINVDVMDWPTIDMKADLRNPLPFPNETVDHIFSREFIEHLPFRSLQQLIHECFRVMKHGGKLYFSCPDFEAIMKLYDKKCVCVNFGKANRHCPNCKGNALISEDYWRSNLIGNQEDYGDGGINDSHKNQITYNDLKSSLQNAGFELIERDQSNRFYEEHKRIIKLSVRCIKP